jgi:hypothetical protein
MGSRGIALHVRDLGARKGGWSAPSPVRFTPGKDPVPIVQDAVWGPGPFWTCAKNLAPTGIRSPDRPARSQSLSRPLLKSSVNFILKYSRLQNEDGIKRKAVTSSCHYLLMSLRYILYTIKSCVRQSDYMYI